jgi:hypothetical protein
VADELSAGVDLELSVARVQWSVWPIEDEEAVALDGEFQRVAGVLVGAGLNAVSCQDCRVPCSGGDFVGSVGASVGAK